MEYSGIYIRCKRLDFDKARTLKTYIQKEQIQDV
jgi:hypothetical protein